MALVKVNNNKICEKAYQNVSVALSPKHVGDGRHSFTWPNGNNFPLTFRSVVNKTLSLGVHSLITKPKYHARLLRIGVVAIRVLARATFKTCLGVAWAGQVIY